MWEFLKALMDLLLVEAPGGPQPLMAPRSPQWPKVRAEHLQRESECQCCLSKAKLEVHHVKPFHLHPDLELDPANLITLCDRCHLFVGHLGLWASYNPTCRADVLTWRGRIQARP